MTTSEPSGEKNAWSLTDGVRYPEIAKFNQYRAHNQKDVPAIPVAKKWMSVTTGLSFLTHARTWLNLAAFQHHPYLRGPPLLLSWAPWRDLCRQTPIISWYWKRYKKHCGQVSTDKGYEWDLHDEDYVIVEGEDLRGVGFFLVENLFLAHRFPCSSSSYLSLAVQKLKLPPCWGRSL